MSLPSLEGLSPEQLKALVAEANKKLKAGITSADPDAVEIAGRVKLAAEKHKTSVEKVLAAVKGALTGKTGAGGTRKKSFRNAMADQIKEDDETAKFGPSVPTEEIEKDFIARFGQEKFEALKAEYPPSPSAKYKK